MGLGLKAAPLRASLPTQPCSRPSRATASSSRAIWSRGGPVGQSPVPLPAGELGTHWEASDTQQLATAFPSRLRHWQKFTVKVSSVRLLKSHFLTLPGFRNGFRKARPPDGQNGDTQTVPPQPALAGPGCCPEGLSASVGSLVPVRGPGQQLGLPGTEQMGRAHEHVRLGPLPLVPWGRSGQEEKLRRQLLLAGGSGA